MSEGMPYADIIILALIAGFVLLRLRSVLGQNVGHDPLKPEYKKPEPRPDALRKPDALSIDFREPAKEEKDETPATLPANYRETLASIRARDASFTYASFMDGARGAFEMVFDAFAKGDRETLKMLLSPTLYKTFAGELDKRTASGQRVETTLLAILSQDMMDAKLTGNTAQLSIRFVSEQVSVVRDATGAIIEGDPSAAHHVEDEWTFERDITSRNPNWTIIDT